MMSSKCKGLRLQVEGNWANIIGVAVSKATVAVFQLRFVVVMWHEVYLWFFLITVTIICVLVGIFDFVRCDPMAHVSNPTIDVSCWIPTSDFSTLSIILSCNY